jgi:hypothetical protein
MWTDTLQKGNIAPSHVFIGQLIQAVDEEKQRAGGQKGVQFGHAFTEIQLAQLSVLHPWSVDE